MDAWCVMLLHTNCQYLLYLIGRKYGVYNTHGSRLCDSVLSPRPVSGGPRGNDQVHCKPRCGRNRWQKSLPGKYVIVSIYLLYHQSKY